MNCTQLPGFITLTAIYFVFGSVFTLAGGMKLLERKVPDWFVNQFSATFLSKIPGLPVAYWSIAALECLIPCILIVSIFNLEFVPGHSPFYLSIAVGVAALVFGILGFGLRLVNDFQGAANSFFYFAGAVATQIYIQKFIAGS